MTPAVSDPAVVLDGVWEAYRVRNRLGFRRRGTEHWALRGIDLSVAPGQLVGIIGGNGSGKTTLLQVVAGVLPPSRGALSVTGPVASLVDLGAGFHRDLTGEENLAIGGVLLGLSRAQVRARHDEIVAFSGLEPEALGWPLASYSAGMGLRLGFSLVVHSDPRVLLVDEVLAVGDDAFQQQCLARVAASRDAGTAVLPVSHDMGLVESTSDAVLLLDRGEAAFLGEPAEAVARHRASPAPAEDATPAADRALFTSWRTQQARRRRGVP